MWQGYGQGEAGVISMLTPEDIAAGHVASVGRPLPAVEVADPRRRGLRPQPAHDGRLLERPGPDRARCCATAGCTPATSVSSTRDGLLHLTGRARDVIMVNAEVCYAGAIERVLAAHPEVAAGLCGRGAGSATGEAVHAFVVPAGERVPDAGRH